MAITLSPKEMQSLVAQGGFDVVDVRNPREWEKGHLPGSRLVPMDDVKANPAAAFPRDKLVLVCASGMRSTNAAKLAEGVGRRDVYHLDGGIDAWTRAGLPIIVPEPTVPPRIVGGLAEAATLEHATASGEGDANAETPLDALVGANLRELRKKRGYSLDELAARAQVSRSLLGQIELGRQVPSIGVVWRLAQSLEVHFSTLLSSNTIPDEHHTPNQLLKASKAKRLLSADGRFSSRALFPFGAPRTVEFYELWLAPHSVDEADAHQPGTRENRVVTAGRLELKIGTTEYALGKGDAMVFAADVPHVYKNPGAEELWMYLVMTYTTPVS